MSRKAKIALWVFCVLLAGMLIFVSGCAEVPTKTVYVPKEVKVVVSTPCLQKEQIPQKPKFALDDPAVMLQSSYKKMLAALAELEQRRAYEMELEAVLLGCVQ